MSRGTDKSVSMLLAAVAGLGLMASAQAAQVNINADSPEIVFSENSVNPFASNVSAAAPLLATLDACQRLQHVRGPNRAVTQCGQSDNETDQETRTWTRRGPHR